MLTIQDIVSVCQFIGPVYSVVHTDTPSEPVSGNLVEIDVRLTVVVLPLVKGKVYYDIIRAMESSFSMESRKRARLWLNLLVRQSKVGSMIH